MNDERHVVDLYADAKAADADYRAAEKLKRDGVQVPYLVTLSFASREEAHELIESVKEHGGVIASAAGMHTRTVPCVIMDYRPWGGSSETFGPKWPNHFPESGE